MTPLTFRLIQQRWNTNTVRLPVSTALWRRDGQDYLNRIAAIVKSANQEHLLVVLAAFEDLASGAPAATGLPSSDTVEFWKACAAFLKNNPGRRLPLVGTLAGLNH